MNTATPAQMTRRDAQELADALDTGRTFEVNRVLAAVRPLGIADQLHAELRLSGRESGEYSIEDLLAAGEW